MEAGNTDGFGYAYVKDGDFVMEKWALPLSVLLKRNYPILTHLPYDGWTIAHSRAMSCGVVRRENSHPFVCGDIAGVHNGTWSGASLVRTAMENFVNFTSTTDSEVAFHLINQIGMEQFVFHPKIDWGGVFVALRKNGTLQVGKVSGDLVFHELDNKKVLIASELDDEKYKTQIEGTRGFYSFDKDGFFKRHRKKEWSSVSNNHFPQHNIHTHWQNGMMESAYHGGMYGGDY